MVTLCALADKHLVELTLCNFKLDIGRIIAQSSYLPSFRIAQFHSKTFFSANSIFSPRF
jgi:hypothetical protein